MNDLIKAIIQLVLLIITNIFERNAQKKQERKELTGELYEAIKNKDDSAITALLDKLNRM